MKNIIALAEALSIETCQPMNTGHVLLAMTRDRGRCAKLLRNFGVNESKVRVRLREERGEPDRIVKTIPARAREVSRSFQPGEIPGVAKDPSDLHLLLALLKTRGSCAVTILDDLKINVETLRMQALACLTGQAANHATRPVLTSFDTPGALPLERYLAERSPRGQISINEETRPLDRELAPPSPCGGAVPRVQVHQLIRAGREIEQIQRKNLGNTRHGGSNRCRTGRPMPAAAAPSGGALDGGPAFELTEGRFPLLFGLGRNLTEEAKQGGLDDIVGRDREMERIADVLSRRRANCPCIIGPSGVGKTALVQGLACRLATSEVPEIGSRVIIELCPADLLAGTSVRGALAERLSQLRQEVAAARGNVVLFFDEMHALLTSNDGQEAVQELKTALGRGEMPCIAATTIEEYRKTIEADPALARRFTTIEIGEPGEGEAVRIIEGIIEAYETHHRVRYEAGALAAAVKLSSRYLHDRVLPDKAISLVDTAGARARRRGAEQVTAGDIAGVLAEQIGVPADRLTTSHAEHLLTLEETLSKRIVGHEHVLSALGETLRRNAAGFRTGRPIGSFLFLGPTGVGKTETAKALGEFLFPIEGAFVRLDMSEFQEAHAVARLIGAPPGYVGHQEGGQLTEAVRRRPYSMVLLDEIEKAHPEVLQILLQVLDDGRLTDGLGRTVSFENTLIVMTSNLGSDMTRGRRPVGFGAEPQETARGALRERALSAVRAALPPELWNRIDELLVFEPLTRDDALAIAALLLGNVGRQLAQETGVVLEIGDGTLDALAEAGGYDPAFGARPMRRTIQRLVEGPLSRLILEGAVVSGDTVVGLGKEDRVVFEVRKTGDMRSAS